MTELHWFSALLIGLAGGVHCVGMCGGFAAAFSMVIPKHQSPWPYLLAYNSGRIFSYTIAGAISGYLGTVIGSQLKWGMAYLSLFSGIMLLLLALYIGSWWRGLARLEQIGSKVWRHVAPLGKTLLPFKSPLSALPYGMLWGWLPCGLVYSTLSWSMAAGTPLGGAGVMFWFGIGTLPALMFTGAVGNRVKFLLNSTIYKNIVAFLLLVFSAALIWRTLLLFNSI